MPRRYDIENWTRLLRLLLIGNAYDRTARTDSFTTCAVCLHFAEWSKNASIFSAKRIVDSPGKLFRVQIIFVFVFIWLNLIWDETNAFFTRDSRNVLDPISLDCAFDGIQYREISGRITFELWVIRIQLIGSVILRLLVGFRVWIGHIRCIVTVCFFCSWKKWINHNRRLELIIPTIQYSLAGFRAHFLPRFFYPLSRFWILFLQRE